MSPAPALDISGDDTEQTIPGNLTGKEIEIPETFDDAWKNNIVREVLGIIAEDHINEKSKLQTISSGGGAETVDSTKVSNNNGNGGGGTTSSFLKPSPRVGMRLENLLKVPINSSENGSATSMMDEAWEQLARLYVNVKGQRVGTIAAIDTGGQTSSYDHEAFVRDFVPCGLASLMKTDAYVDIVKNFMLKALHLQGWEKRIDNFTLGEGVMLMLASFESMQDPNRQNEVLQADFGGTAIGRVVPVDWFWWNILLQSNTKSTHDYSLSESHQVQGGMKLILNLSPSDHGFDTFPTTLLCADGCSMIDRPMGICGYPVEIRALFFFALRCAGQLLKPDHDGKELIDRIDNATAIKDLIEVLWADLIGEMPLEIANPALEGHERRIVTGCDPKNTRWSYQNGGSWPGFHAANCIAAVILHSYISFIFNLRVPAVFISHQTAAYSEILIPFPWRVFRMNFSSSNYKILGHSPIGLWLILRRGLRLSFFNGIEYLFLPNLPNEEDDFPGEVPEFGRITSHPGDTQNVTMLLAFLPHFIVLNRFAQGVWTRRTVRVRLPHVPMGVVLFHRDFIWMNAMNSRVYRVLNWTVNPNAPIVHCPMTDDDDPINPDAQFCSALGFSDLYLFYLHPHHEAIVYRSNLDDDDEFAWKEIKYDGLCLFVSSWGEGLVMPSPSSDMQGRVYFASHRRSDLGWLNDPDVWHRVRRCRHMQRGRCGGRSYWFRLDYDALCGLEQLPRRSLV